MDIETLGAAIAVVKGIPGSAAGRSEAAASVATEAAQSASESATLAEQHSYGVSVSGTTLRFIKEDS